MLKKQLSLILFDGLRPAFLGLILGLTASAGATQLIRSMLYGTEPTDPAVIGTVILTLLLIFPAWRASHLDPIQALRTLSLLAPFLRVEPVVALREE